jgi:hypothetical protein
MQNPRGNQAAIVTVIVLLGLAILFIGVFPNLRESRQPEKFAAVTPIITTTETPPAPTEIPPTEEITLTHAPIAVQEVATSEPTATEETVVPDTGEESPELLTGPLDQTGTLWAPYLEWSLENTTYEGNPFDLIARVEFTHTSSEETRRTEMFFAGEDTWKFRFTGTRTGEWTFFTTSEDSELDGHEGSILIEPNPDPQIKGFLVTHGNRFARQVGENGELEAFLFNVWQGGPFRMGEASWFNDPDPEVYDRAIEDYVLKHGTSVIFAGSVANRWFDINVERWDEHDSENPDLRTFEALEKAIVHFHKMGLHMHIWMWGDEDRRWTQVGVGGINGEPDRRLQRYIAARLGPLPGWSMSYGFDLGEKNWVGGDQGKLTDWAEYLQERMGWPHLLFSRGYAPPAMSGISYSSNGPGSPIGDIQTSPNGPMSYDEVVGHMDSDLTRPHLYEERFIYLREFDGGPPWTMERTRKVRWWNTMAGGVGAWWGVWDGPMYPDHEPMLSHARFWERRFLLDMERANHLADGYALKSASGDHYVFYKEDSDHVFLDLTGMSQPRQAVAVDTTRPYEEIPIGRLEAAVYRWEAPYPSDWAIAVGFEE